MSTPRLRVPALAFCGAVWAMLAAPPAQAQRGIDTQLFRPAMDSYGIFSVERADVSYQWDFGFKLYGNFAGNPLRLKMHDAMSMMPTDQVVMSRQVALNLGMHLGLTRWLQLAIDLPLSSQAYTAAYGVHGSTADPLLMRTGFYEGSPYTNIGAPDASPLDARLGLKAKLFRKGMVGMAASAVVTIPFGDDAAFLGDTGFTFRPNIILDVTRGPITAAVNVGAIIREHTTVLDPREVALRLAAPRVLIDVGHELTYAVGMAYRFVHWVGVAAEFYGLIPLHGVTMDFTADILGGLQLFVTKDMVISLGAGANVVPSAYRHDEYRAFLGLTWAPVGGGRGAAAIGGLDTDSDGVPDTNDLCPNEPEDRDGFEDDDGCPDPDNDRDGIPDRKDRCPNDPEDRDGFEDQDGCPETDNDNDGIPDVQDRCPNDPEDRDGFQDDDGCPDADNDGDGIPDAADRCPNEAETLNGIDDDDGCPDAGGQVRIAGGRIEMPEQILFDAGNARLSAKNQAELDKVAEKLKANPTVKRVRIEGHADRSEPAARQQVLSEARANAVRDYLMRKGVEGDRLAAVGYGAARPIDKRTTAEARAKNRRVELTIVEQ